MPRKTRSAPSAPRRLLQLLLAVVLSVSVSAPVRSRAEEPCARVTFQWVSATVVKLWTDATFDPPAATATAVLPIFDPKSVASTVVTTWTDATLGPEHAVSVLRQAWTDAVPDPRTAEYRLVEIDGRLAVEAAPAGAPPTPRRTYRGPPAGTVEVIPVAHGPTRVVWQPQAGKSGTLVLAGLDALYLGRDGATGSTFLLDVGDSRLLDRGGRVDVVLRNVRCAQGVRTVHVVDTVVVEQHHIAVDVGAAFTLDAKGSLPAHPEFALDAYSRWSGPFSGEMDLRLVTLEKVAKDSTTNQGSFLESGGNTLDLAGRVLLNADPRFPAHWFARQGAQPWFAVVAGLGARSVPSEGQVDVRARYLGGVRLQALGYNADRPAESFGDARAHVEIGYARDWFWRDTMQDRLYAETQLEIPNFGARYIRFLARAVVDRPLHFGNRGPSEIRLSVLSSINPALLGQILGFTPKASP